ncbi:MAG TPA: ThiF family adenylyltransferase [Geobacteraceae bacterium]|nr:ThiF family adenylyltransferase [Geobacteraceae bacterium]
MKKKAIGARKTHIAPQFRRIVVAGVGGTGSYLAQGLAKLVSGYRLDLQVLLVDPDVVEEKNCARQNFHPWEIGQGKAEALAYRLNQQYGIQFAAAKGKGEDHMDFAAGVDRLASSADFAAGVSHDNRSRDFSRLIITCVDSVEARKPFKACGPWLDLGNGLETGQALYGTTEDLNTLAAEVEKWDKLPTVGHLPSPYLAFGMAKLKSPRKPAPSCADTPFAEQGVFANEWAAAAGLAILHQLLVKGGLTTPAIYFDTARGRMSPEYITREYLQI